VLDRDALRQLRRFHCRYATRQGWDWQDSQLYSDKAISGASLEGRAGLQALQAAALAKPRPFDVLLVDDTSRVGRDLPDALRFLQQLTFAGVRVVCISQGLDSASPQAETLFAVHGIVDSLYLKELASKIKRGLRGQAERGYATGSVTYGYRTVAVRDPSRAGEFLGWRIEVEPTEANTIREIFEWYASGVTLPDILRRLKTGHYPTPRGPRCGGVWKRGAVVRLLKNERYVGRQIWGQRRHERKPGSRKKVARQVPRSEWVVVDRPDLRIISDDLWHRAHARRREHTRAVDKRRAVGNLISGRVGSLHGKALFTGFMTCGVCGGTISLVNSRTVNGVSYSYFGCYDAHRNGVAGCSNRVTARAEHADPVLLSRIQSELTRPETVDYIMGQLTAGLRKLSQETPGQREALIDRREETKWKVQRLLAALEHGAATATLLPQLEARETELAALEAEIRALAASPARTLRQPKAGWVKRQLADVADLFKHDVPTAKATLARLGITFKAMPVYDGEPGNRPYLRADGETDLTKALFGAHDRLSSERSVVASSSSTWPPTDWGPGWKRRVG
jgi:DNA invertase Pin-like site-specific DNA recombinase